MLCSDVIQHSEIVLGAVVFRTSYLNIPLHLVSAWRRKVAARASVIYFAITAIGGKRSRASNDRAVRLFDVDSFGCGGTHIYGGSAVIFIDGKGDNSPYIPNVNNICISCHRSCNSS